MKIKNLIRIFILFLLLIFFIKLFFITINLIGFSFDKYFLHTFVIYFILLITTFFIGYNLIEEILFILFPIIKKIVEKLHKKPELQKPELIKKSKKKPKKKKIKKIEIPTYTKIESKGELFKRLGIKYEKIKKPKETKKIELKTKKIKEIPQRDLSNFIEKLNKKGYIEITDDTHFGSLRGHDILLYLKRELKKRGIKTKKIRKKLVLQS